MTDHAGIVDNHLIDDVTFLLAACKIQRARIAELEAALRRIAHDNWQTAAADSEAANIYAHVASEMQSIAKLALATR